MNHKIELSLIKEISNIFLTLFICLSFFSAIVESFLLLSIGTLCLLAYFFFENKKTNLIIHY